MLMKLMTCLTILYEKNWFRYLDNWELLKSEIKETSKNYGIAKAKQSKTQLLINEEIMKISKDGELLYRLELIDKEIKNYGNKGNVIRSQNETLNKLFQEGREISRKLGIK